MKSPDPQFLHFLSVNHAEVAELALALRETVLEEAQDAVAAVFKNHPAAVWFGFGAKMKDMVLYIAVTKSHVNLGFCYGTLLPDPVRAARLRNPINAPCSSRRFRWAAARFRSRLRRGRFRCNRSTNW